MLARAADVWSQEEPSRLSARSLAPQIDVRSSERPCKCPRPVKNGSPSSTSSRSTVTMQRDGPNGAEQSRAAESASCRRAAVLGLMGLVGRGTLLLLLAFLRRRRKRCTRSHCHRHKNWGLSAPPRERPRRRWQGAHAWPLLGIERLGGGGRARAARRGRHPGRSTGQRGKGVRAHVQTELGKASDRRPSIWPHSFDRSFVCSLAVAPSRRLRRSELIQSNGGDD